MHGGLLAGRAQTVATAAALRGTVVADADGAVIPCAGVRLDALSGLATDEGEFGFTNIPPGTHSLMVAAPGFVPQTLTLTLVAGETAEVIVRLVLVLADVGEPPAGNGDVVAAPAVLRGRVLCKRADCPIAGARLTLDMAETTTSDDAGRFEFGEVTPGGHVIEASAAGFKPALWAVTVAAGEVQEGTIRLDAAPRANSGLLLLASVAGGVALLAAAGR